MRASLSQLAELRGKRVVILGLGKNKQGSGVGAAKWCMRNGMRVLVTDMLGRDVIGMTVREVEKAYASYVKRGLKVYKPTFVLGEHRERDILDCDMVVQNPDVKFDSPFLLLAARHGKRIETDLSLFFTFCPFPIIGITGTRGKTTTTMLTGAILLAHDKRAVLGGNMRVSPLESLDEILKIASKAKDEDAPPPIVLEISSWQAEALARSGVSPHIAALTNLSEDHLNRYGTMAAYAAAKESLFAHQRAWDIAVFSREDAWGMKMATRVKGEKYFTSRKALPRGVEGVYWKAEALHMSGQEKPILTLRDVVLEGEHNLANISMAVLISILYGAEDATIRRAVRAFKGVPHRQEIVREWRGITFVNDTTATSPDGVRVALDRFGKKGGKAKGGIVLIGGGTDKAFSYEGFAKELAKRTKYAVLFKGTATDKLLASWPGEKPHVVDSMRAAFEHALGAAEKGDVVLLSPGAASFGVFLNEFDRGDQFVEIVKELR